MSKRQRFYYYQLDIPLFWSDYTLNGLNGFQIGLLRAVHDQIWLTAEKALNDDSTVPYKLRISPDEWEEARRLFLSRGLLVSKKGYLCSPHLNEAVAIINGTTSARTVAALKSWENRRKKKPDDGIPY